MAATPSKNDLEIVREYFAEKGFPTCPICQSTSWTLELIAQEEEYRGPDIIYDPEHYQRPRVVSSSQSVVISGDVVVIPLAVFVCDECLYVMHFAWLAMVRRVLRRRNERAGIALAKAVVEDVAKRGPRSGSR
jgi:hypothetical protein